MYKEHLGPTLAKKLAGFLAHPHHEQVALYEELALSRTAALDALKLFELAEKGDKKETKALAHSLLRDALNHVKEMVLAVSRVEHEAEDKVSLRVINLFVLQIVRAIYRVCGDEHADLAKKIEEEIEENVRVPSSSDVDPNVDGFGTDLTPDAIVKEMDQATVGEVEYEQGSDEEEA